MLTDTTWRCDVCKAERPDDKISVAVHTHVNGRGVQTENNVKFCNDQPECEWLAMLRDHAGLAASSTIDEMNREISDLRFLLYSRKKPLVAGLLGAFCVGVLIGVIF